MTSNDQYDCIVIGGGPAGATCATILADHGRRTLVLERGRFPRFHVGESLMPQTYWTFKRLGVLDALRESHFVRKESVQFVTASGKESRPYYFTDRDPNEWSTTWQVRRDEFDKLLLDNARAHGAEVREGVGVRRVLFEGDRAIGVAVSPAPRTADASVAKSSDDDEISTDTSSEILAKVVVDATGQSALLSRQLRIITPDPKLRKGAIYAHYRGGLRDTGRDEGATLILHTPNREGWFWYIPLPDDIVSVGVIGDPLYLFHGRGDDPGATLSEEIANCPAVRRRLIGAERASGVYVTSDLSYRADRMAGDGWVLVGDAFGFLDPVYSAGVLLALKGGEFAADAIHDALEAGDVSGERLGRFAPELTTGLHRMRMLVHAFYDKGLSFGAFFRDHPEHRDRMVRLLIGDLFTDEIDPIFDDLRQYSNLPAPVPLTVKG